MPLSARDADLLQQRQANVYKVMDVVTKPLQFVIEGIQMVLFAFVFLVALVGCGIYGVTHYGPKTRTEIANLLDSQAKQNNIVLFQYRAIGNTEKPLVLDQKLNPTALPMTFDSAEQSRYTKVLHESEWNFENVMGATDTDDYLQWAEGKQTPMYAALSNADKTSKNLWLALRARGAGAPALAALEVNVQTVTKIWRKDGFGRPYLSNDRVTVNQGLEPSFVVTGMCLPHDCTDEDLKLNTNADLFGQPSVTPGQGRAIAALNKMASDNYWLAAAHTNGVNDDAFILKMAAVNRANLSQPDSFRAPAPTLYVIFVFGTFFVFLYMICNIGFAKRKHA